MDIQLFGKDSLKIKSKRTTVAIDPKASMQKFDADAVILSDKSLDFGRINNFRVIIDEIGEYEVSGLKITGIKSDGDVSYVLNTENVKTIIAKASSLKNASTEKIGEYQIAVINVDSDLNHSVVTAMEPNVVVLYGEKAREGAKALGKENVLVSSKISISEDKLPEEMDIMLLG